MKKSVVRLLAIASAFALPSFAATTLIETFEADPMGHGWDVRGETELFTWDHEQQNLRVTWDSSRSNSYFARPLGTVLTRDDDFELAFDLWLDDIGPANEYQWSFQLAVGFLNLEQATQPGFLRGSGFDSPNVVEVAYFRADDFGNPATVYPTFIGTNSQFNYNPGEQNSTNYTIATGEWHRIRLAFDAASQAATFSVTNLSGASSAMLVLPLNQSFSDYRVSAIAINNYHHAGQFPGFEGSLLAHGRIDNIEVVVPSPPVRELTGSWSGTSFEVKFESRAGWMYTLQRRSGAGPWADVSAPVPGTGMQLTFEDANPPGELALYRVRADRP